MTAIVPTEGFAPFRTHPRLERTFWQRIFRRPSRAAASVTIENLLTSKGPSAVGVSDISEIVAEHRLQPGQLRVICTDLWRKAVATAVSDNLITDAESDYLAVLRRALQITEAEASAVEAAVVHPKYKAKVSEVLADGFLSDSERGDLDKLMEALRISAADYPSLYGPIAKETLTRHVDQILEDKRVSPEELAGLAAAAKSMRVDPQLGPATESVIRRYGEYWKIENGELPIETDIGISLQRGEICHYVSPNITWSEPRTKTVTTDLGSVGYSFRIARGVYYRSPRIRATRVRQDILTPLADGEVYFTNKRVIFDGEQRNFAIRLSALIGIEVFSDGIKLEKSTGRSPVLLMVDVERAAVILSVLLAQA